MASSLKPKERITTIGYDEICATLCTELSYRDSVETINHLLHRTPDDGVKLRTLADAMQRMGEEISSSMMGSARQTLSKFGFDPDTGLLPSGVQLPEELTVPQSVADPVYSTENLQDLVNEINASRDEKITTSLPDLQKQVETDPETVYISVDDIGVKRQKDTRGDESKRKTKTVQNTVVHIQQGEQTYVITALGMSNAFQLILSFLLANNLLQHELVFLTDGARDIKFCIASFFSFYPHTVVLDWYHLRKKTYELLSMALRGNKEYKNSVLQSILRNLWVGNVSGAKDVVQAIPDSRIKNEAKKDEFITYLDNKADSIACYAVRKELGLRTSSNQVEKSNDLVVAQRQKHNGMSWTPHGSGALAAMKMIFQNKQEDLWFHKHQVLGFPALEEESLAA